MTRMIAFGALLACGGCIAWTHPTKPQSELPKDRYECERESAAVYPAAFDRQGKDLNEENRRLLRFRCLEAKGWQ